MGSDMKGLVKEIIGRIFPKLDRKIVLYGNSKIYMKMDVAYKLDRLLQEWWKYKSAKAAQIQRSWKHYLVKKQIKEGLKKIHVLFLRIKKIQALVRMFIMKRRYMKKKKSIAISKRYLTKVYKLALRRNFDKLRTKL